MIFELFLTKWLPQIFLSDVFGEKGVGGLD